MAELLAVVALRSVWSDFGVDLQLLQLCEAQGVVQLHPKAELLKLLCWRLKLSTLSSHKYGLLFAQAGSGFIV